MSIELTTKGAVVTVQVTGKLTKADYEHFVPEFERLIQQHGKVRVLFEMHDFHGWDAGALWEDVKFDLKHFRDIERLAFVGETAWEAGMAHFCRPFTTAGIRYFDRLKTATARQDAEAWIATD